jgi:hypothetical protein
MVSAMEENQKAKREVIGGFFEEAEARVAFLVELAQTGHEAEAMTLCLTYIDSFAQWLRWPASSSARNFVEALMQFGGNPLMALAHPLEAILAFRHMKAPWPGLADRIQDVFANPPYELLATAAFVDALRIRLTSTEIEQVRREMWRTTIANLVYQHLRNASVHAFGGGSGIWLSLTTHEGAPVPPIRFQQLLPCVRGLVAEARRRSDETGQWFGNDAIVKDA